MAVKNAMSAVTMATLSAAPGGAVGSELEAGRGISSILPARRGSINTSQNDRQKG